MKRALFTLFCTLSALAQWPTDPAQNLLICDHTGEQALPKIAALSDGGCYIAWQDLASGNYDIYLQRLDANGVPQWADPCGILISDYPQDTWLTDWDIATDVSDNCILAINDIRNGSDRDITVYSIGPEQDFRWGADGIALSSNDGFEPDPRILAMANGDVVFAWQEETFIHVRKLDADGNDVFDPELIYFTQANGVSIPRLAALDSTGFALSYLAQQGSQFTSPRYLYVRAYNDDGSARWVEPGIEIMNLSGIGIQMRPDLISDGAGGVYVYWYDARGNVHHCYVQHIENDGVAHWTANGVSVDASAAELQMSPSAVNTGIGVVIFYQATNTSQSQGGLQAQYLNTSGQPQWNMNGVVIAPLSAEPCFNVKAYVQNGNYAVFYSQYAPGSQISTLLRASQLTEAGQSAWTPAITTMCSAVSEKGRPYTCLNSFNQIIAAWPDARDGDMDIYAQNVNSSGSLGPLQDIPPLVRIDAPEDGAIVHAASVDLVFDVDHFNLGPNNREGSVLIFDNGIAVDTLQQDGVYSMPLVEGLNTIRVELFDLDLQPLEPRVVDSVHVTSLLPSISITWPWQPPDTLWWSNDNYPYIRFSVENFVVADSGGDGRLHLLVRDVWRGGDPNGSYHVTFDSIEVPVWYFTTNEVVLSLVGNDGFSLPTDVADTVYIQAWQVSADPIPDLLPTDFTITGTYPNPFNASTTIEYALPTPAHVTLDVIDITGRNVRTLLDSEQPAGLHRLTFDANGLPSGLYFVRLTAPGRTDARKIVLLK
ncbi:MAG: T9SS type A sorting domain-containing protein [bacterium]|nr:T9SS type A sorting domain-containing protein [bacterium]